MFNWLVFILAFSLSGCNLTPAVDDMVPATLVIENRHPNSVSLIVKGKENGPVTFMSSSDLKAAIEKSILQSGVFSEILPRNQSEYTLAVDADIVINSGVPSEVKMAGGWQLIKNANNKVVLDEFIQVHGLATLSDSVWGNPRTRLALSRAAMKFIEEGIQKLGKLKTLETKSEISLKKMLEAESQRLKAVETIKSYQYGITSEKEFLGDDWKDLTYGKAGNIRIERSQEEVRYVIGFTPDLKINPLEKLEIDPIETSYSKFSSESGVFELCVLYFEKSLLQYVRCSEN